MIQKVIKKNTKYLFKKKNVVAVGYGYKVIKGKKTNIPSIVVGVTKKLPEDYLSDFDLIPKEIDGCVTDVIALGEIKVLENTQRLRPSPGGCSFGSYRISAGTLGCLVKDNENDEVCILSNNHIAADSNDGEIGDPCLQPGVVDGGKIDDDTIGYLKRFVPINFEGSNSCPISIGFCKIVNSFLGLFGFETRIRTGTTGKNKVDCAIARPTSPSIVIPTILDIGYYQGIATISLDTKIKKSGRTTSLTSGIVQILDATIRVNYGEKGNAIFEDQIVSDLKCAGGDSGSATLTDDNKLVGLLFAGSDSSSICNKITNVFSELNVKEYN